MIKEYHQGVKKYKLYGKLENPNGNIYSVIIGKNGTGKSRLLSSTIREFVDDESSTNYYRRKDLGFKEEPKGEVVLKRKPTKIIAVSTSPYDKYPLPRIRENINDYYRYFGLRDLRTHNFGLAFITKIIGSLFEVICFRRDQYNRISNVLNYLGFTDEIVTRFELRFSRKRLDDFISKEISNEEFERYLMHYSPSTRRFFKNENNEFDENKILELKHILSKRRNIRKSVYDIHLSSRGIENELFAEDFYNDYSFLIDSGILRLREFGLRKKGTNRVFRINQASSGEQCIVTTFLGIACHLEDNSLICIDEPEISLHPEWQARFIKLLISTFKDYKKCHFIIATHSPQLISNLSDNNCFILNMEKNELLNASDFIKHSIDFQLANLFNYPGFKNEYLNRIAFSIMSKVAKKKKFDKEDIINFEIIQSQIEFMSEEDPIKQLFDLIKDLKNKYA